MKRQLGFSLMEMILAIGIIAVVGTISSNLLTRSYRTSSNTETLSKLKQNGSIASGILSESIRMADGVVCYGLDTSPVKKWIVIRTSAGKYNMYRFVDPLPPSGSPITQNGYIAMQENLNPVDFPNFCLTSPSASLDVTLTDNNLSTGVSISKGEFKWLSGSAGKDTVTIKFDVSPPSRESGASGPVNIQTTVQVR